MNKEELVQELLKYFLEEGNYSYEIPSSYDEKRTLLRSLINMREPFPIKEEILKLEDELLQIELKEKGIVDGLNLKEALENISLYLGDLTTLKVDAIVNAGNSYGLGCFNPTHRCLDNNVHTASGIRLRLECSELLKGKTLNNGDILVCNGYNLPCKYVITTVGPEVQGEVTRKDEEDLVGCYKNALEYAIKHNFKTIAFSSISTGLFSYPINKAKLIAYHTVKDIIKNNKIKVIFVLYSKEDYDEYRSLFKNERKNK